MNIIKEFTKESKKIKGCIQCYESSNIIFDLFTDKYKINKEKRIYFKNEKIKLKEYLLDLLKEKKFVSKIEIRIYSDKTNLNIYKDYSFDKSNQKFIFKDDKTRLFVHSFNIISDNKYIISQSWFKKQEYNIIYELNDIINFFSELEKTINNFIKKPEDLFKLFKYNDDIKTIKKFITTEIKEINVDFIINYKIF